MPVRCLISLIAAITILSVLLTSDGYCGGGPLNVLLVVNSKSTISKDIGAYYQKARSIPKENVFYINCSTSEFVSKSECENRIREPIRRYLQQSGLVDRIDYIVLTKGIPLGAYYEVNGGAYSTASVLMCIGTQINGPVANPYGPTAASYWPTAAPECAWSHRLEFKKNNQAYNFYLVTRLDAYTVDQVKQIIDKSVKPAVDGRFLLDKLPSAAGYNAYANDRLGVGTGSAYNILVNDGHEAVCDASSTFVGNKTGLMGYFSWGKNDPDYTFTKYMSNSFVPGSIADCYFSFSAKTFVKPQSVDDRTRESLLGDLIERGICGAGGYVSEPIITTATHPNILFDRYTKGYNMAESFYMACPEIFWKTVVIGDPLMAPFATPPQVTLMGVDKNLSGITEIEAMVTDDAGIGSVEFYFDGNLIATDDEAPYTLSIDTTQTSVGPHTVEVVAYENTPVATQGSAKASVYIQNEVSTISRTSEAVAYPDGQDVSLSNKVVVAGTDVVGGAFYIEENDRSFGIKVLWPGTIMTGDVVSFVGPVTTIGSERCISASQLGIITRGASLPKPLIVKIGNVGGSEFNEYTPGTVSSIGLRNIGLLVKVVGRVISSTGTQMVIGDGNGNSLTVKTPWGYSTSPGTMLAVTGVVDCKMTADGLSPLLLADNPARIQMFNQ